jgi:pilus assembly protein Flp/PilA
MELKMSILKRFAQDESGATAIEYGLIASLIAVVIIGALKAVGGNLTTKFGQISNNLS